MGIAARARSAGLSLTAAFAPMFMVVLLGGSALALLERTTVDAVTHAVLAAAAHHGHPEPAVHQAIPSRGAHLMS